MKLKWRIELDGNNYVVKDVTGKVIASSPDKRTAVEMALAQAVGMWQPVEITERTTS